MASRSHQNIIIAMSLAESLAHSVAKGCYNGAPPKTVAGLCNAIQEASNAGVGLWRTGLTAKEIAQVRKFMAGLERIPDFDAKDLKCVSSILLGVLDEVLEALKDPVKRQVIGKLSDAVWRLHRYYDRSLEAWESYAKASRAIEQWRRLAG